LNVEATALRAPAGLSRLSISLPLLRLRSDDQLLALFRAGSNEAFNVLHDRYRQRLFAYVRQMLSAQSRQDAEDVLQDVFVRAFGALRADARSINVRAWLYRVAHNRCIDHLRRPVPAPADVFEMSRTPLHDPLEDAQRREDLRRLVTDVGRLPDQQRSALLMREIDGMSYADLATALDVTVPAVKSLLVRARLGLVEAAEARSTDCAVIREDLTSAYDRGVKASGRARRHMRECSGCREYRTALRSVRSSFAALSPGVGGAAALAAKLFGLGGGGGAAAGGAAASSGGAVASSGGAVAGGGVALGGATACKVAAVVCTAALTAGGAVEVKQYADHHLPARAHSGASAAAAASRPAPTTRQAALTRAAPARNAAPAHRSASAPARAHDHPGVARPDEVIAPPSIPTYEPQLGGAGAPGAVAPTGGVTAPDEPAVSTPPLDPGATTPLEEPTPSDPAPVQTDGQAAQPAPADPGADPTAGTGTGEGAPAPSAPTGGARGR
jgi:RNA polymerase sigma factor (sigma-70 family)